MTKKWAFRTVFLLLLLGVVPFSHAVCDQHYLNLGSGVQYFVYSDGEEWNFTAGQTFEVTSIETSSRIAGSNGNVLSIEVLVNSSEVAQWSQSVTTTYISYVKSANSSFVLNSGDIITYRISGGTMSNPGGAITDPSYVQLCGANTSISGTVYQSDGTTPITGDGNIHVELWDHNVDISPLQTVSINMLDGTFVFNGLAAGQYDLRVVADNFIDEWWASSQSVYYRHQLETITLVEDQELTEVNFQLDEGIVLSGTVYQTDGTTPINQPIDVLVYVDQSCGKAFDFRASIDGDGIYTVKLPPGTFYADAGGEGYITEWWTSTESVRDCSLADSIIVSQDSPVAGIDFQLEEGTTVSGFVYHEDGSTAITGPTDIGIQFFRDNPCAPQGSVAGGPISNDGSFSYDLEPGTYYVVAKAADYVDEWWADPLSVYSCSDAQMLTVGEIDITDLHFQLAPGNIISGTVYHRDGSTPYTNAQHFGIDVLTVDPCLYNYETFEYSVSVDSSFGTYSVHVPDGDYYVLLNTGSHFSNEWWATPRSVKTDQCEQAQLLTVTGNGSYSDINFQIGSDFPWNIYLPALLAK